MERSEQSSSNAARLAICYSAILLGTLVLLGKDFLIWNWCATLMGAGATIAYLRQGLDSVPAPSPFRWVTFLFPAYVALQLVPLPFGALAVLSPERATMLADLRDFGGVPAFAPLTAVPAETWDQLLRLCFYATTFFVIRSATWRLSKKRNWLPVFCLLSIAALEAILGLLQVANGNKGTVAEGTYWNRNHFAGLLEMALPMAVAFGLCRYQEVRENVPGALSTSIAVISALLVAVLCLLGITFSASKSAIVGALIALYAVVALSWRPRLNRWQRTLSWTILPVLLAGVFLLMPDKRALVGIGDVLEQGTESDLEGRLPLWRDTLRLWAAYPLFGSGAGTFPTAFTKFQTTVVDLFVVHAHNDYLEFLSDLGGAGAALLFLLLGTSFRAAWRVGRYHPSRNLRHMGIGCAGAMSAIFLHSLTDFNMFHRGNATCFTWIAAIAMGLAATMEPPPAPVTGNWFLRPFHLATGGGAWTAAAGPSIRIPAFVCAAFLLIHGPAWIWVLTYHANDPVAEMRFCRLGICDTDAMLSAQTTPEKGYAAAPLPSLLESVRRDVSSHSRWYYLCDALQTAGRAAESQLCIANVIKRAPELAGQSVLVARYYASVHDAARSLNLMARVLGQTAVYDQIIFATLREHKYPTQRILAALPAGSRAPAAYLRSLMRDGNLTGAQLVWDWLLARKLVNAPLAIEYTSFLIRNQRYQSAATAWAASIEGKNAYDRAANYVYNGGFELPDRHSPFDWSIGKVRGAEIQLDTTTARDGNQSVRVRFTGEENLYFNQVEQAVFLPPGAYRFRGFLRTEKITTGNGVGFSLLVGKQEILTETLTGTNGWTAIERTFHVSREMPVTVRVVRQPVTMKFDARIQGNAWIDAVSIVRLP